MQWFKYSIILFLCFTQAYADKFNSVDCLKSSFTTDIKNNGKLFGLIKNDLRIQKSECIINIDYKNILNTKWKIDVCRKPIHIKLYSKGSESVFKRTTECTSSSQSDYCEYWFELKSILSDYGLIYANGEREVLSSSHGQTYCTYLILSEYLGKGTLFSTYDPPKEFVGISTDKNCDLRVENVDDYKESENALIPAVKEKAIIQPEDQKVTTEKDMF